MEAVKPDIKDSCISVLSAVYGISKEESYMYLLLNPNKIVITTHAQPTITGCYGRLESESTRMLF